MLYNIYVTLYNICLNIVLKLFVKLCCLFPYLNSLLLLLLRPKEFVIIVHYNIFVAYNSYCQNPIIFKNVWRNQSDQSKICSIVTLILLAIFFSIDPVWSRIEQGYYYSQGFYQIWKSIIEWSVVNPWILIDSRLFSFGWNLWLIGILLNI